MLTSLELCAGAGGQALGLHWAGFCPVLLIDQDKHACQTLNLNNQAAQLGWGQIHQGCIRELLKQANFGALSLFMGVDLLAAGVPCPPFSIAGQQQGAQDDRDLFPVVLDWVAAVQPKAVLLENVPGLLTAKFAAYRDDLDRRFRTLGYTTYWQVLQASDFGVPQLRPRVLLVALQQPYAAAFTWPTANVAPATVGEVLMDLMAERGWAGAQAWSLGANAIAPTLVGGSKKHGGPDLGPTRAKQAWQKLGVNGHRLADEAPAADFVGDRLGYEAMPYLTVKMAARLQGFPDWWQFSGRKTPAYRQVGNALPPPVAQAVGLKLAQALTIGSAIEAEPTQSGLTQIA